MRVPYSRQVKHIVTQRGEDPVWDCTWALRVLAGFWWERVQFRSFLRAGSVCRLPEVRQPLVSVSDAWAVAIAVENVAPRRRV